MFLLYLTLQSTLYHKNLRVILQVPNTAILECHNFDDLSGKQFNIPGEDKTAAWAKPSIG